MLRKRENVTLAAIALAGLSAVQDIFQSELFTPEIVSLLKSQDFRFYLLVAVVIWLALRVEAVLKEKL